MSIPAPTPLAPLAEHVAADLRRLADIATTNPAIAGLLAFTLAPLRVHIPATGLLTPHDVAGALETEGGRVIDASPWAEPWWLAVAVELPGGTRVVAEQMREPDPDLELDAAFASAADLFQPTTKEIQA